MKIGAFAGKYGLNTSAVRYYVDKALITPKRENDRYIFDNVCMEQIEKIIEYKNLRLSLEEIETLFCYERASNLKDKEVIKLIISVLENKVLEVENDIKNLTDVKSSLCNKIDEYKKIYNNQIVTDGFSVPLETLDILECPVCGGKISLSDALIDSKGIKEARLKCSCGYEAAVSDGILLCDGYREDTPLKAFDNINTVQALTDEFSPSYINLQSKAHLWQYQKINSCSKNFKYIMAGPFAHNFLLEYLRKLPENSIYIIIDISVEKIRQFKKYFSETDRKILFAAGDINKIPLKENFVDLYIDDFSICNYIFTYNGNLIDSIARLLKKKGNLAGLFVDYEKAPNSLNNFKKDHPDFKPELMNVKKLYSNFENSGIRITDKNNLGAPHGNKKDFTRQFNEEKVQVFSYFAEKIGS